jgi:superfamily II RNA helicase
VLNNSVFILQVALPPDAEFVPLTKMPETMAKEYPFILDPFQKEALLCLENNYWYTKIVVFVCVLFHSIFFSNKETFVFGAVVVVIVW